MKLIKLRKKLEEKKFNNIRTLKTSFQKGIRKSKKSLDEMKIIAITGSSGKSTTAVLLHENLKALGYKSVLYSSAMVDSPASLIKKNEAYEVAVRTEEALLSIINEAEAYGADYLVLEVNESTIEKGFLDDVDFDVRVLTNLNPKHNLERYTEEKYVSLKKALFRNVNKDCKCIIGLQDYDKQLFNEILGLNICEKLTFTSNYIANVKGVNPSDITCLLTNLDSSLDGLTMRVKIDNQEYEFSSKVIGRHNALNFVCVITILKALNVFNFDTFKKCIQEIKVLGRSEVYHVKERYVIIEPQLGKMLETLSEFKSQGIVNSVKVVVGSVGHSYKNWDERYKTKEYIDSRKEARQYACELLKHYADYIYLTENDNGAEQVLDICNELQNNLEGFVPSTIIEDREQAIRQAILESQVGDAIFISGRGNRKVLCNSETTMKLIKDSKVVEQVLEELGW